MKIFWTEKAEFSYSKELENINKKWTSKEVANFINLVDEFIKNLESGLIEGKTSSKRNIRSFVISKQTTLFFVVNEKNNEINLILFWNNKDNPKKLKKELRSI
ncbi:hypothetical protein [uncultured Algibacter sp.]|uniref:hypothetical protein n=1 Tax=uncultured Algibacter sp. TaxID=298659 RepID=UPI0032178A42